MHLSVPRAETPPGRRCHWLHHRAQVSHSRSWTWVRMAGIHHLCYIGLRAIIKFQSNFLLIYSSNSWMTPIKSITNVASLWIFALNKEPMKLLKQWQSFYLWNTCPGNSFCRMCVSILGFSNNTRCATTTTLLGKHRGQGTVLKDHQV